jgi:oxygen-independent coproporphyrinogen-3 oxidase
MRRILYNSNLQPLAGIYIHIPFCRQACHYCNFHFSTNLSQKEIVLRSIHKEIELTEKTDPKETINTIYFGGGTPSLLTASELKTMLDSLKNKFDINPEAEITLEANPDDIHPAILESWLKLGVNRLSLGIQSFNEAELKWMNRAHNAQQSLQSIDDILAAGFNNFSVDLIYGSPMLNNDDFEKNATIIFEKNIPHISCYALTVEEKTALHHLIADKKSLPVDEARQAEQFQLLLSLMDKAGYEQYEISNFSLPGFRSKHNSSYWQGKPYYGFGPAAHSFNGKNKRRWNVANNALYIQAIEQGTIPFEEEVLTATQQLNEYMMISLRTIEGIDPGRIGREFGKDKELAVMEVARRFMDANLLIKKGKNISLTREGKFLADGIAAELFFD